MLGDPDSRSESSVALPFCRAILFLYVFNLFSLRAVAQCGRAIGTGVDGMNTGARAEASEWVSGWVDEGMSQ